MEEELIAGTVLTPQGEIVDRDKEGEVIQPEVLQPQGSFPAPFNSKIGNSTVDLSDRAAEAQMKAEYDEWWNLGKKRGFLGIPYQDSEYQQERNALKDKWYRKYHGMGLEDYKAAYEAQPKNHVWL